MTSSAHNPVPPGSTILYFGSFNPPHRGHIAVADRILDAYPEAELWWVVSPQNPLKPAEGMALGQARLEMVALAIESARHRDRMRPCDIEFGMPRPSATIDTLEALSRQRPGRRFTLLIGSDNVADFPRWIRYRDILDHYPVLVYPREGYPMPDDPAPGFTLLDGLPLQPGAGTDIRRAIAAGEGDAIETILPPGVPDYIRQHRLYGYRS